MSSEEEIEKLKKKIRELEQALKREKENRKKTEEEFEEEKAVLKKEKEKIIQEFEEFKAKHAVTVSNLQEALKIKADKRKKSKPLGLPEGHKGYSRHVPERWDTVKPVIPKRCPHCNSKLEGETQEVRNRFVTDIKLVSKPVITKYEIHRKYCRNCKKLVEADVPNVLPHASLGLNLMLLVMYLKLGLRLPGEKIVDFLLTSYGVKISGGEVVVILKQLVGAFGNYYGYLEKLVKLARVKHTDTTTWRVSGRNYFAWVFITSGVVLYKIRKRNNHQAALTVFGIGQDGNTLVIDRHAALRKLAEAAGFLLQFCWAHILQDSKELAKAFGSEGLYVHRKLKEIYALAKGLDHKGSAEQVQQLQGMIFELMQRHYKHKTVWRFVNNLYYRDVENLFRFVTDPEIPSTNNLSERELRHLVLMRKVSNGSRSQRGATTTAILTSVIQTLRFKKENVLSGLHEILKNPSGY